MTQQLRARALELEKERRYADALAIYAKLLTAEPTDLSTMKRCIALRREAGEQERAQALLTQLLGTFPADTEAWLEAADMALSRGDVEGAAFALEEVLLAAPENHHVLTRYAELQFTQGGAEQRLLARHYFALAVELAPTSLRALHGLRLSAHAALVALPRTAKDKDRSAAVDLLNWSTARLAAQYKGAPEGAVKKLCSEALGAALANPTAATGSSNNNNNSKNRP